MLTKTKLGNVQYCYYFFFLANFQKDILRTKNVTIQKYVNDHVIYSGGSIATWLGSQ